MRLNAPEERAGQRTMCPKCLRPILIPSPEVLELLGGMVDVDMSPPEEFPEPPPSPPTPAERTVVPGRGMVISAPRNSADSGRIVFSTAMMSPVDLANDLSTAISMRMKPPPDPPADLSLTTGLWLMLTLGGIVLWLISVGVEIEALPFVALIGVLQAAVGYFWAAYLVSQRSRLWGILTLFPPIGLVRLFMPYGENRFRPLRFVLSGLLILAGWVIAPKVREEVSTWPWVANMSDPPKPEFQPTETNPAEKLKSSAASKQTDQVVGQLQELSRPETVKDTPEAVRPDVVSAISSLLLSDQPDVRSAALNALAVWAPANARLHTLLAIKSTDTGERRAALALAVRWPDAEMATAVAKLLTDRQVKIEAQYVLLTIGGPAAEAALLPLLKSDNPLDVLFVLDLIQQVGGPKSIDVLRELNLTGTNRAVRSKAGETADAIEVRLHGKK